MAGRPHRLADPDFANLVANCFVAGMTREQMCEELDVNDKGTITRWRRDPRVKVIMRKLTEDRIFSITRKTDAEIQNRLENASELSIREILEIRKEFLGGGFRREAETPEGEVINEALDALEKNPNLMEDLQRLLAAQPQGPSEGS